MSLHTIGRLRMLWSTLTLLAPLLLGSCGSAAPAAGENSLPPVLDVTRPAETRTATVGMGESPGGDVVVSPEAQPSMTGVTASPAPVEDGDLPGKRNRMDRCVSLSG